MAWKQFCEHLAPENLISDVLAHMVNEFSNSATNDESNKECACFTMYYLNFFVPYLRRNSDPNITADSMWNIFLEYMTAFTEEAGNTLLMKYDVIVTCIKNSGIDYALTINWTHPDFTFHAGAEGSPIQSEEFSDRKNKR